MGFIGAFYRWIFFLCRKPYSYYMDNSTGNSNVVVGIMVTGGIIVAINYFLK
jgi:hypothetical protein